MSLSQGLVTHLERQPVDVAQALRQWEAYVSALRSHGWAIVDVAPDDACPDAVFIEDAAVMFGDIAVACRPGAESRRPEVAPVRATLQGLGVPVLELAGDATLDGGDVLKIGKTVYVGLGGRSNAAAVEQLGGLLQSRDWTVIGVPVTRVLHLKSAVTALPDGRTIGWPPVVDDISAFDSTGGFLAMPEERGAHVVHLGANSLLLSDDCPRSIALLEAEGYDTVQVNIDEFEKLEGCVTCLSIRIRPDSPEDQNRRPPA